MLTKRECGKVRWIDLERPDHGDVRRVVNEYNIHPIIGNELLSPTLRSKVDVHDDYIYVILHFPSIIHRHNQKVDQEIDFIVGKDFLITGHYEPLDIIHEFAKIAEANVEIQKGNFKNAGFLFYDLVMRFYTHAQNEEESLRDTLEEIEHRIFNGEEHRMVGEISKASRNLLNFKKSLHAHRDVIASLEGAAVKLFGDDISSYIKKISGEHYRVADELDASIETLRELRKTNDSLLTTRTNDIMRILTIMAFVTFPLMLLSSIFGMNTQFLPLVGNENDFWIIIALMATAMITFFGYFKYKKWL